MDSFLGDLKILASFYGILTEYQDSFGKVQQVPIKSLLSVFRSFGLPLTKLEDVSQILYEAPIRYFEQLCEPIILINGNCLECKLKITKSEIPSYLHLRLKLENGESRSWSFRIRNLTTLEEINLNGKIYFLKHLKISNPFPWGYHQLRIETLLRFKEVLIISAPSQAFIPKKIQEQRTWGIFAPLYALHSKERNGIPSFTDFGKLLDWLQKLGASYLATLPLLSTFIEADTSPSPYAPLSRLFWNEFYLDLEKIPELKNCSSAKRLMNSIEFQEQCKVFQSSTQVDYPSQMSLKRKILSELARYFFKQSSTRRNQFQDYLKSHPQLKHYAQFRAVQEKLNKPWQKWPIQLREGRVHPEDYSDEIEQYHLYIQWLAQEQMQELSEKARQKELGLFLDLPLGSHSQGYEVWKESEIFARGVSVGAPSDDFFCQGQNWGFPPLHPQKMREQGYRYFRESLHHSMQFADLLRIDHIMSLHRLYWIPHSFPASEGCYVSYPTEELYAILCLESHRSQTLLVGEDLGTVSPEVRSMMKQKALFNSYVLQCELKNEKANPVPVPANSLASLNTHDMPPFALFWKGKENVQAAFQKYLAYLCQSSARMVLINLEDLWFETEAQNRPGTCAIQNWSHKMSYSMEEFFRRSEIMSSLQKVNEIRKSSGTIHE